MTEKEAVSLEDISLKKINVGIIMSCNNIAKIFIQKDRIIIDCPSCNFQCGFSKKKQRVRLLK